MFMFAGIKYRFDLMRQSVNGIMGLIVVMALSYLVEGSIDWLMSVSIAIGVFIGSGFVRK